MKLREIQKQKTSPIKPKHEIKKNVPDYFKVAEYKEKKENIEKDKKIQVLFNRALSREKRAQLIQEIDKFSCVRLYQGQFQNIQHSKESAKEMNEKIILQDTTSEKFKKLNENRENFQNKYGKFNEKICTWLKIDNNLSVSVIERESEFDENAKSETGADSLMQLTNDPFDDMKIGGKGRGEMYLSYFKDMPDNIILGIKDKNINKCLVDLKKILNNDKISKSKLKIHLNKVITYLHKNRKNPELNLLIGNIYLSSLRRDATDEKIDLEIKKLSKISIKRFKFLLKEKGINLEKENEAKLALINLQKNLENKKNEELRINFYALSRYNGDNTHDKGVAHKITYAAVVSVATNLRNNNKIV